MIRQLNGFVIGVGLLLMLAVAPAARAQADVFEQDNVVRWAAGKYTYRSLGTGQANGREDWLLTVHPDGSRTMRATNAFNDRVQVLRHVVLRADSRFRPLEAYVNYWIDGRWRGSGFATVTDDALEIIVNGPNGRSAQTIEVPQRFSMVPQPISTNSWATWYYDRGVGGPQPITLYVFDGRALGPRSLLGKLETRKIRFVRSEPVTTPAGTFDCDRFEVDEGDPVVDLFGTDRMIARMTWRASNVEYILTDYRSGPAAKGRR